MTNFTKSIVYSGVILAVGLVAVFAIYNNAPKNAAPYAQIAPAAGEESSATEVISEETAKVMNDASEIVSEAADAIGREANEIENAAQEAVDEVQKALEIEPAAGEKVETPVEGAAE